MALLIALCGSSAVQEVFQHSWSLAVFCLFGQRWAAAASLIAGDPVIQEVVFNWFLVGSGASKGSWLSVRSVNMCLKLKICLFFLWTEESQCYLVKIFGSGAAKCLTSSLDSVRKLQSKDMSTGGTDDSNLSEDAYFVSCWPHNVLMTRAQVGCALISV